MTDTPDGFYAGLPVFRDFTHVMDPALFRPLPDDWMVGAADVVQSTRAIAENRYKAVNMAGAAVIVAVTNALGGPRISLRVRRRRRELRGARRRRGRAREALAATAAWVRDDLDLALRIGMVRVADIRAAGLRRACRALLRRRRIFSIAMFGGGGIAWADAAMKRGEIAFRRRRPARGRT